MHLLLFLVGWCAGDGRLRVLHTVWGGSAVDVLVDGARVATNVVYGSTTTNFPSLASGVHPMLVTAVDQPGTIIAQGDITVGETALTAVVSGTPGATTISTYPDYGAQSNVIPLNHAAIKVVHLSPNAGDVSVYQRTVEGIAVVAEGIAPLGVTGYIDLMIADMQLEINSTAGEHLMVSPAFVAGSPFTLFLLGQPPTIPFTAVLSPDYLPTRFAYVRIFQGSPTWSTLITTIQDFQPITTPYATASPYLSIPLGSHGVSFATAAAPTVPVFDFTLHLTQSDQPVTLVAWDDNITVVDDMVVPVEDTTHCGLRFAQFASGVGVVYFFGNNEQISGPVAEGTAGGYTTLTARRMNLFAQVGAGGPVLVESDGFLLRPGRAYTVFLLGDTQAPSLVMEEDYPPPPASAQVRFLHGVPSVSPVVVYINDEVQASAQFEEGSHYVQLTPGDHQVRIVVGNDTATPTDIFNGVASYPAGAFTTAVTGVSGSPTVTTYKEVDTLKESIPQFRVALQFIHLSPDSPAVDVFVRGVLAFSAVVFRESQPATYVQGNTVDIMVAITGTSTVLVTDHMTLSVGDSYVCALTGLITSLNIVTLPAFMRGLAPPLPQPMLRVVHSAPLYPGGVDVDVGGVPVVEGLDEGAISPYHNIGLTPAALLVCPYEGLPVGGACWYQSPNNGDCRTTCMGMGLVYDDATRTFAGSDGTDEGCEAIAIAFNMADTTVFPSRSTNRGCWYKTNTSELMRDTAPTTSTARAGNPRFRFCACTGLSSMQVEVREKGSNVSVFNTKILLSPYSYTAILTSTPAGGNLSLYADYANQEHANADYGVVRFMHTSPTSGAFDFYYDVEGAAVPVLLFSDVPFGEGSSYAELPARAMNLAIRATGTGEDVATVPFTPTAGSRWTIFAQAGPEGSIVLDPRADYTEVIPVPPPVDPVDPGDDGDSLKWWAILLIVLAVLLVVALIFGFIWWRRRKPPGFQDLDAKP